MTDLRARVLGLPAWAAAIFLCCVLYVGSVHADTIPSDPIIDMEGGGSIAAAAPINFAATNTGSDFVTSFILNANPSCTSFSDTSVSCNTTMFFTNTGPAIANMDFLINTFTGQNGSGDEVDINQQGFQAPPPKTNPAAYQVVYQNPNGIEAIYAAPAGFEIMTGQQFEVIFQNVLVPTGGSAVVHMDANVPVPSPEPATVALFAAAVPVSLLLRRRHKRVC